MITLGELQKTYGGESKGFVEITDRDQAVKQLESHASACWGSGGRFGTTGWVQLASPSPQHVGDKQTVFVCKASLVEGHSKVQPEIDPFKDAKDVSHVKYGDSSVPGGWDELMKAMHSGDLIKVDESIHDYFLEVLPPRRMGKGYFIFQEGEGDVIRFMQTKTGFYAQDLTKMKKGGT